MISNKFRVGGVQHGTDSVRIRTATSLPFTLRVPVPTAFSARHSRYSSLGPKVGPSCMCIHIAHMPPILYGPRLASQC